MTIQMSLFPDVELVPTPVMQRHASLLVGCRHCGTLVCVPSTGKNPGEPRTTREQLGSCPSCSARLWRPCDLGEGPFKPHDTSPHVVAGICKNRTCSRPSKRAYCSDRCKDKAVARDHRSALPDIRVGMDVERALLDMAALTGRSLREFVHDLVTEEALR
ncbi:MAG: hypothetical protein HKN44_13365 [Ilumatobacter sp.]|nr:hypothetical protein [Ilumatobacter sp.]